MRTMAQHSADAVLKIGLTGGVASGKSTVARMFEALGATVIDTDVIAREVVEPGQPGLERVKQAFGAEAIGPDGRLERTRLRALVFADNAKRRRLESILHPLIRERTLAKLRSAEGPYAIVVVPLLVETGFGELVDRVLVVDVAVETQLERLLARDRITPSEARAMIEAQIGRAARLEAADDVIDNDGDLDSMRTRVEALHRRYLELAAVCRAKAARAE